MRLDKNTQNMVMIIGAILIAGGAFAYGALTAPQGEPTAQQVTSTPSTTPAPAKKTFEQERETIIAAFTTKYPKVVEEYTINKGKLYGDDMWYGTSLSYKGSDTMNRDTLRLLMQKKDGIWTVRTTPPEPILSKYSYDDVPIEILRDINKAVSLPGSDTTAQ